MSKSPRRKAIKFIRWIKRKTLDNLAVKNHLAKYFNRQYVELKEIKEKLNYDEKTNIDNNFNSNY